MIRKIKSYFDWLLRLFVFKVMYKKPTESHIGNRFRLMPGSVWNPILKYPRNHICFCGSRIKFKDCHLEKTPKTVPSHLERTIKIRIKTFLKRTGYQGN